MLLLCLPGALLACVIHCSLPAGVFGAPDSERAHFLCNHGLTAEGPPPVTVAAVQALVQGLAGAAPPVVVVLVLLRLACAAAPLPQLRPAEGPPAPPPRPR